MQPGMNEDDDWMNEETEREATDRREGGRPPARLAARPECGAVVEPTTKKELERPHNESGKSDPRIRSDDNDEQSSDRRSGRSASWR